jgi:DNA mismatch repair protein MSH3
MFTYIAVHRLSWLNTEIIQFQSLEDRFSLSPTKPAKSTSAASFVKAPPSKSGASDTKDKLANAKKRKRVIEEDDDEFEPGSVGDDDYEIKEFDVDDEDDGPEMVEGMEISEDDVALEASKPAKKKKKLNNKLEALEERYVSSVLAPSSSSTPLVLPKMDGSRIEEKLEYAMTNFNFKRHEVFSERVVASVERARDRMMKYMTEEVGEEEDGEDVEEEEEEKLKKGKKTAAPKKGGPKYTPLEQQYLEIRKDYPDSVLFVESGYRYRFFGKDAEIAAKVLNIRAGLSHNFLSTSVPVHRLHVHAMRLVQAGYKVGVVSQTETAALKAISSNKSGPFKRAVSALYTKSTLVNESMDPLASDSASYGQYLMAIYESHSSKHISVDSMRIDIVAVKTSTGDIVYDSFEDGFMRTELETRLRHINPIEIVLSEKCSDQTKKLIENVTSMRTKEDIVRIEYLKPEAFDLKHAKELIKDELVLFSDSLKDSSGTSSSSSEMTPSSQKHDRGNLGKVMQSKAETFFSSIEPPLTIVFGALAHYLKDFGISSLICLSCNFNSFSNKRHMYLDGNALANLELLVNQNTLTKDGSLLSILDRTSTSFGKRRLMQWIRQPLLIKSDIEARLEAVEEISQLGASSDYYAPATFPASSETIYIANTSRNGLGMLLSLLPQLPDLERGICRIFYNRCSVSEFISVLVAFKHIEQRMPKADEIDACCQAGLLKQILKLIPHDLADHVNYFLNPLNVDSSDKQKRDLFIDDSMFPAMRNVKVGLKETEDELAEHLDEIRKLLGKPRLEYVTKNKDEYVIELTKAEATRAPKDWIALASPKTMSRFHTTFIIERYQELQQYRERLTMETTNAWASFVAEFAARYTVFRNTVDALAMLDCLNSFASLAKTDGYVKPRILDPQFEMSSDASKRSSLVDDYAQITIKNGRHPVVESLLAGSSKQFVPNDTLLGVVPHEERCIIITGPNMGGKTCYARQVAVLSIMAQMGCYVPAEEMHHTPLDMISTRMGAYDNMVKGQSTFFVELQETSDILKSATSRSLVILDELGRGTSTHDGFSIAFATLHHLLTQTKCFTLFVTHYPALSQLSRLFPKLVQNHHISYLEENDSVLVPPNSNDMQVDTDQHKSSMARGPRITFLHKLVKGVEGRSFGMNVAHLANLPGGVVSRATEKSNALEHQVKRKYAKIGLVKLYQMTKATGNDDSIKTAAAQLQSSLTS